MFFYINYIFNYLDNMNNTIYLQQGHMECDGGSYWYDVYNSKCGRRTYFECLVVNTLGADIIVAGIDQGHGLRESRQL